jgi:peptide/nickel transport system substrate-binding protein
MTPHGRSIALFVGVAVAAVYASGCARPAPQAANAPTLRIGVGVPTQERATAGIRAVVDLFTKEAIVTNGPDGRQSERIATSWKWNDDRTVLRMVLRKDVFFHDGTRVTPELVAQSLKLSVKKREAFSYSSVVGVNASGPDTVDITLAEPNSFLIPDLSLTALRMPEHPEIGTGPFRLVESGGHSQLQAFEKYYKGRPALETVEVHSFSTQRKAWAAMLRGELGMLYEVSRDAVDFVEAETTVRTYSFPRSYYIPFVFNVRHPVLRNVEVRRALNEAIDRSALIADGLRGRGKIADGPIWPGHWTYADSPGFAFNPDAARLRLDKAGFPVRAGANGAMPSRFAINCMIVDDSRFERLALLMQRQLSEVGVDLRLTPATADNFNDRAMKGDFDTFLYEMAGRSLSWVNAFWHSPSATSPTLVNTGYTAGDQILDNIRRSSSDDDIRRGVADLMRVFHDDPPAAFLSWQVTSRAVSTNFDVSAGDPDRDIFTNVWQWHAAAPLKQAAR